MSDNEEKFSAAALLRKRALELSSQGIWKTSSGLRTSKYWVEIQAHAICTRLARYVRVAADVDEGKQSELKAAMWQEIMDLILPLGLALGAFENVDSWKRLNERVFEDTGDYLKGVSVLAIDYDAGGEWVAPEETFPVMREAFLDIYFWLRSNWGSIRQDVGGDHWYCPIADEQVI